MGVGQAFAFTGERQSGLHDTPTVLCACLCLGSGIALTPFAALLVCLNILINHLALFLQGQPPLRETPGFSSVGWFRFRTIMAQGPFELGSQHQYVTHVSFESSGASKQSQLLTNLSAGSNGWQCNSKNHPLIKKKKLLRF